MYLVSKHQSLILLDVTEHGEEQPENTLQVNTALYSRGLGKQIKLYDSDGVFYGKYELPTQIQNTLMDGRAHGLVLSRIAEQT